ncbi:vitamin B6 photo-protection and homoeostasis-domain-containing protein [Sphaerosporella brunnea]|uniref:Vitamin B6 photo-protection and homoeostasis-domain-containing protein n=1 Tax=Sphaerosporella brunnea TaxID=1250544 RepID=A0A5J5ELW1_9PEZI|nr:vitamin B6 photo-protection and homoeostasis-domain-containing protein [Sphaerosporella brunnea]
MSVEHQATMVERDESGNVVATYGHPLPRSGVSATREASSLLQRLISIFLPAGFPASVTEDYDSLQAFSSSIAGLLTSRAVLQGACRDANASATNALLLTILQDSVGRIATILFAYKFGPALEAECKKYRFMADIFNDSAMIMDCLSPVFPRVVRIPLLCLSGSLRALCGVAGGASKASLSVHFAKTGNVGELNAKDSSQETVISLLGMLAGSFVVSHITSPVATWIALVSLLAVHLATNYKAVRCVAMRTLNRQRTNIVFSWYQETGRVLTPKDVCLRERVLETGGILRWGDNSVLGFADVGVQFATVLTSLDQDINHQGSGSRIKDLANIFRMQKYILWPTSGKAQGSLPTVLICLKAGATAKDQVKAWSHALIVAKEFTTREAQVKEKRGHGGYYEKLGIVQTTMEEMDRIFPKITERLVEMGWDVETACIETSSGFRITAREPVMR